MYIKTSLDYLLNVIQMNTPNLIAQVQVRLKDFGQQSCGSMRLDRSSFKDTMFNLAN